MANELGKKRLLLLAKLLAEQTDDEEGVTMAQIIEHLETFDIEAERKAIYRDLDALREVGADVRKKPCKPAQYYLANRPFSRSELLLLLDAVQSSRFITKRQSDALVRKVKGLASHKQAAGLDKRIHVGGRIKSRNESVFHNVDAIQEAMAAKRRIVFKYASYDCSMELKLRHGGKSYDQTPVELMYADGFYYLVCYSDKYDDFANYRVDRMRGIRISDEPASRNARIATFDADGYDRRVFGMYTGEAVQVTLRVREEVMNAVADRFGKDACVENMGDGTARVSVPAMETQVFFGWVAQFSGKIVIEAPASVRGQFAAYLQGLLQDYERPQAG